MTQILKIKSITSKHKIKLIIFFQKKHTGFGFFLKFIKWKILNQAVQIPGKTFESEKNLKCFKHLKSIFKQGFFILFCFKWKLSNSI
jgi:hypothetical protein